MRLNISQGSSVQQPSLSQHSFFGNGVFHHRHDQLHIPFQSDDGELSQGDVQAAMVAGDGQLFVEQRPDACGNLDGDGLRRAALAGIL